MTSFFLNKYYKCVIIFKGKEVIYVLIPEREKAKIRTKNKAQTKKYSIPDNFMAKGSSKNLKELGLGKTYYIKTYGCQMNVHDSENIKAILEEMSFKEVDEMEKADLILLNTCAIR